MKKNIITLATILFVCIFHLNAQQTFQSLSEAWQYALSNDPEVRIQKLQIDQAEKDKQTASSFFYPRITADINGQNNISIPPTAIPGQLLGKPGQTVFLPFGKKYVYNSGLNFSKSILDWQSIFQLKIANATISLKMAQKCYFEQSLKEQIAQFYYAAIIAEKAIEIGQADLATSDTVVYVSEKRFKEGLLDAYSFNKAKINRNSAFEKLQQNLRFKSQSLYNLKILLGLMAENEVILTESIDLENNIILPSVIPNTKYTDQYRIQSDISGFEMIKARSKFTPSIVLSDYIGDVQYQNSSIFSINKSDWYSSNYLNLSISIPLFTGFSNKSQYESSMISKQINENIYKNELRKSVMNDSILQINLISSLKIAYSSKKTYEMEGENVQLYLQKYVEGLISLDEYLKAVEDYLVVENQYFNNVSDYYTTIASVESRK